MTTPLLKRDEQIAAASDECWDVLIIGGGATGLGAFADAVSRGYRALLLEGHDFAKGTSSRSTKLIHGGVRYLRQGNISLVRESLTERQLLLSNAGDFVHPQEFVIPATSWLSSAYFATGLKAYDLLAGTWGEKRSRMLSHRAVGQRFRTLKPEHFAGGGVSYFDARFDDARLAIAVMKASLHAGGFALNYFPVTSFLKEGDKIVGVVARDAERDSEHRILAKSVINATGIFCDLLREKDNPSVEKILTQSQGAHLVIDREFFPSESAIIVPETDDGRVLFFIPWYDKVLVGTTDIPVPGPELEPRTMPEEIEYLLDYSQRYLTKQPTRSDIRSTFAGLRPLVRPANAKSTSAISRDHHVEVSDSGLITITGGKWTTFRKMGEDAVEHAIKVGGLALKKTQTESINYQDQVAGDAATWDEFSQQTIDHFVNYEMARTVEDVLARRTRVLFLNAQQAIDLTPDVASKLAASLGRSDEWREEQVRSFTETARGYHAE